MQVDSDAKAYLQSLNHLPAELQPLFEKLSTEYDQRLWHQVTLTIQDILSRPSSAPLQLQLFEKFISTFQRNLDQLRLVQITTRIAQQFSTPQEALDFLSDIATKVDTETTQDAFILATMECAHFKLLLGDVDGTKEAMTKCESILDRFDTVEPHVYAAFYRVSGDFYKAKAEYANYYKTSLLFLACVNHEKDLSLDERVQRAHDLGLAALLGDIYNFGELLMHPILESLQGTPHEFISTLLKAFNSGSIPDFENLTQHFPQEPLLQENYFFLRQKICLMALTDAVFRRPAGDRTIPFADIGKETSLPVDEVEHLVMKALSLSLIKGTLDQVSQTANIHWVQPRVLNPQQVETLTNRLGDWSEKVSKVAKNASSSSSSDFFLQ